ncbi:hypothetical protein F4801DRAFT_582905 [Xylaria longipes]|nr:hypothetical protein F4801DRAFT_582905 [Xylaria longipes]
MTAQRPVSSTPTFVPSSSSSSSSTTRKPSGIKKNRSKSLHRISPYFAYDGGSLVNSDGTPAMFKGVLMSNGLLMMQRLPKQRRYGWFFRLTLEVLACTLLLNGAGIMKPLWMELPKDVRNEFRKHASKCCKQGYNILLSFFGIAPKSSWDKLREFINVKIQRQYT